MNATIEKFGYPATLLVQGEHWVVLLRPAAVTLGSLILASTSDRTRYGDLPAAAFTEQAEIVARIESALTSFTRHERINYLMLMMVDPHVHFHVVPRYEGSRGFDGVEYADEGWPGLPDLTGARALDQPTSERMIGAIHGAGLG